MISTLDPILASEKYRLETFSNLVNFPLTTRYELALAGFIYRDCQCLCSTCGVTINLITLDENRTYASNYFRTLHRQKALHLGKRCSFLLCELGTNIDDLRTQQDEKLLWEDAEQPDFIDYSTRLQSFQSWPHRQQLTNTFVTPAALAEHGFYYSGPQDGVTCFYCGNTLTDWADAIQSSNDKIVQLEHARFFPCRFINHTVGGKFVTNAGYFHVVSDRERRARNPIASKSLAVSDKPQSIDECLSTFEYWPEYAPISAENLAQAGFYYLGYELSVKCYICDLEVDDWHSGMTAFGTHSQRQKSCELIQAILSTKVNDFQCVNERWRLKTLEGLSFGTNRDERICRELAACGFYRFKNTNHIRCAYCAVLIQPESDSSIMFQHRYLAKQLPKTTVLDCLMVRAQCPTNVVIPDRERFPEHPDYQSIFDRMKSFDDYKEKYKTSDKFIRERADAGFFLDTMKRMRCFQCGNTLLINDRKLYDKFSDYSIAKLHAHFYPTCEWVKELLGCKYIAQVLLDRTKSNEFEHQQSYNTQFSSSSAPAPLYSVSSISTVSSLTDRRSSNEFNMSDYSEESDSDNDYETVATPFRADYNDYVSPIQSPTSLTTAMSAQVCTDAMITTNSGRLTSPTLINRINPFQQVLTQAISPPIDIAATDLSPVDPQSLFVYESNRLDTFKKLHRQTFAQMNIDELAYAGFYLNGEGTIIQCPWCLLELTEAMCERILRRRPAIPHSPLNDEPWTAMRVHRHASGQVTNKTHPWCSWVRRELSGLYSNVPMTQSFMQYPEYPTYADVEKRIKSFDSDWSFPSGSRLSNSLMANAGFICLDVNKVCCYYCGNRLCDFEPRDCPFEEHAIFHPLCDYIIQKRGLSYIERILKESPRIPHARQKYEMKGTQKVKCILFDKTGQTTNKNKRIPVKKISSRSSLMANRSVSHPPMDNFTTDENTCQICRDNLATYVYDP
ncbi:unnamed protein product, partial [Adineta ricciae]